MRQHFRFTTSDNLIGWRVTRQILDYKNWDRAKTMFCRKHAIPGLQSIYMFLSFPRPFQISFLSISLFVSLACPRRFLFFVLLKFSCSSVSSHFPFLYNVLVHKPFSVHFQVFEYVMTSSFPFLVLVVTAFPLSSACPLHLFFPMILCMSLALPCPFQIFVSCPWHYQVVVFSFSSSSVKQATICLRNIVKLATILENIRHNFLTMSRCSACPSPEEINKTQKK